MKRRDFLKQGITVGVAANALPILLGGLPIKALGRSPLRSALQSTDNGNVLVIIQLQGGNDGLNCVVPYGDPLYTSLRPTLGLDKTADNLLVLQDHDTLALHGGMDGLSAMYGAGKVAILQNVGYPNPDLSHFRGTDIWNTATDSNRFANTGWIGRLLNDLNPTYPPSTIPAGSYPLGIQFGSALTNIFLGKNGGMGIAINKIPTASNPSTHNYDDIPDNPSIPYQELEYVRVIQKETEVYTQTLANRSVTTNKATYPTSNLGQQLSQIAQLIASGFTTKVYIVTQGGYDTHSNELNDQANLLKDLSDSVKAFQDDLEQLGIADKVVGMTYSEFGRRPKENGSGTDHGTAAPLFVFGTQVIGGTRSHDPKLDTASLVSGNLAYDPLHDFRNVYASIMHEWLGVSDDTEIKNVLTASNGQTYSTNASWTYLGLIKGQAASVTPTNPEGFGLMLMQNYPNPVSSSTVIEYALPNNMPVQLSVWNTAGEEVARIVDGNKSAGIHRESFIPSNLPSGAYLYRLKTPTGEVTRQMIITK